MAAANETQTMPNAATSNQVNSDLIAKRLKIFDELDFDVFSNQEWDRVQESHSQDILVHWPDGHTTTDLPRHIEDLKALFVYAPDTKIKQHPIEIG